MLGPSVKQVLQHVILLVLIGLLQSVVYAAPITLSSWGKTSCAMMVGINYTSGNYLCASGFCKGTAAPGGSLALSSAYVKGSVTGMSSGTMLRVPFTCTGSTSLTCSLTGQASYSHYGSPCSGPGTISGAISVPAPLTVSLPADATDLVYGINDHAICYKTASPLSVQCRAVSMSIGSLSGGVTSWSFGSPVTKFTAAELTDSDGDGVADASDKFPLNTAASSDSDNDGYPGSWNVVCDVECQSNSGLVLDNCPSNANADQLNTDGDAQGNVCDSDDDNDGISDVGDAFPLDNTQAGDIDADGIDGFVDNCPANANADQADTDGDTLPDACTDTDDDNDRLGDAYDAFPLNVAASSDTDMDGFPGSWNAACDITCQENSGLMLDNCPSNANADQINTDGDTQGNVCDTDDDNDGVADTSDKFPLHVAASFDADVDGFPASWNAACDITCQENSGLVLDNCPANANADQLNTDGDAQGNVCDTDDDNDGVADTSDRLPLNIAASVDGDLDGVPTSWNAACNAACQENSGLVLDNCPSNANADQLNTDGDAQGNVCDSDDDNDGVADAGDAFPLDNTQTGDVDADGIEGLIDNCPSNANVDQLNTDGDTQGNVCDWDDDNDGIPDVNDAFPLNAAESLDTDLDGTGNNADSDDDNDGLPDVMDPLPLQSKFNRDANYKGSQVRDASGSL